MILKLKQTFRYNVLSRPPSSSNMFFSYQLPPLKYHALSCLPSYLLLLSFLKIIPSLSNREIEADYRYRDENRHFIKLANVLHTNKNYEEVWGGFGQKRNEYLATIVQKNPQLRDQCVGGMIEPSRKMELMESFFSFYPDVPATPEYHGQISAATLMSAQQLLYFLTRCPNYYQATDLMLKKFFTDLISSDYSLKTVLLSLVRLITTTQDNENAENEWRASLDLLGRIDESYNLNIFNNKDKNVFPFDGRC